MAGQGSGEQLERAARQLPRLRKLLEIWELDQHPNGVVVTADNSYLLDIPADATDAARFLRLASRGSELLREAPEQAGSVLNEALECGGGPLSWTPGRGCSAGPRPPSSKSG
ncbi:hypothetical protein [Streptomyces chrestomyceticus]|uniref:hypothetical protein n=1 Tax=Streptomyces chrestomyceticus TaxID=68185 RepID=UPI0035A84621